MEIKKGAQFDMSEELKAQIMAEIARAKSLTKMKDCDIGEKLGKSRQGYSAMVANNLSRLGSIEAIADVLGFKVEIKFVPKEV